MDDIRKKSQPYQPRPFVLAPPETVSVVPPERNTSLPKPRSSWRGTLLLLGSACLLLLIALGFLLFKSVALGERMQFENKTSRSFISGLKHLTGSFLGANRGPLRGETEGRINILLLGRAGEHYPGKNLTDTVMIMSIAPRTKQVALLSLPRDLYVPIADTDYSTKLNSLYQYGLSNKQGVNPLKETVERITGSPIHYFVTVDFDGFEKVIDTLGGISLEVPRDFYDPRYPGKNYSYETFEIKKGWQTLDGATALKYVRERHADPEGDFGRAKRQQQVIQAVKNKAFSLGTFFNIVTIDRLLDTLGDSIKTDMSIEDMARFLELARSLDTKNVTTLVVDAWKKESLLRVSHVQVGPIAAFILVPRVGNWSEIRDESENIFERDKLERRKEMIRAEHATLALYAESADFAAARRMATLLEDELGFLKVTLLPLPPLNKRPEESIMIEQNPLTKPYSLDGLLKRFALAKTTLPPATLPESTADFRIIMGTDLAETFSLSEAPLENVEDPSFSEPLPPQPKKKK